MRASSLHKRRHGRCLLLDMFGIRHIIKITISITENRKLSSKLRFDNFSFRNLWWRQSCNVNYVTLQKVLKTRQIQDSEYFRNFVRFNIPSTWRWTTTWRLWKVNFANCCCSLWHLTTIGNMWRCWSTQRFRSSSWKKNEYEWILRISEINFKKYLENLVWRKIQEFVVLMSCLMMLMAAEALMVPRKHKKKMNYW